MRHAVATTLSLALVCACLGGCASLHESVGQQVDAGVSATASGRTAVGQLREGAALPPFTNTVLSDSLTELQDARDQVELLHPSSTAERGERDDALAALGAAIGAVLAAQQAVDSSEALDFTAALDRVERALDTANGALEHLR